MTIGWNIKICGFDYPIDKNKILNMQNYYPLESFPNETEWLQIRILGLEGHFVNSDDSVEFNKTIVEFPYVKYAFNFNSYPLDVKDDADMLLFHKVNLLKTKQYKFMTLEAEDTKYPILNSIPDDYAMLFSNKTDWSFVFNYNAATRRLQNSWLSYFPMHTNSVTM